MNVIKHNPDRTVGIVTEATNLTHIGGFSYEKLDEWLQTIKAAFEMDEKSTIHLFAKKSATGENYALFASLEGNDPLVVVAGKKRADDEGWGKVYEGEGEK